MRSNWNTLTVGSVLGSSYFGNLISSKPDQSFQGGAEISLKVSSLFVAAKTMNAIFR